MNIVTSSMDLQGSPELFRLLADNLPQLAWIADADGSIFWYNRRWFDYTGTTLEEMVGWGWRSVHHPDHVEDITARFKAAVANGEGFEATFPLRRQDGVYRHFLTRAEPIRDDSGTIVHWFGTNTDVTDQLATEQELRLAEERVSLALAAGAIIGTWDWDLIHDRFTVDQQFAKNFGLDPALGRTGLSLEQIIETVHPDDKPGLAAAIAEVIARGGPYAHQYRVRRIDGQYYWIEANGRVDYREGKPFRFPGVLLDVEERRRVQAEQELAAAALAESEARFRSTAEALPGLLFVTNAAGENIFVNQFYRTYAGLGDELLGDNWAQIIHPDDHERLGTLTETAGRDQQGFSIDYRMRRADGEYRWHSMRAAPSLDGQGSIVLWVGVSLDIHDRREAVERARAAAEELEAVYATAPVGLTVLDRDLRFLRINERMAEINGLPAQAHLGQALGDLLPAVADNLEPTLQRVLAGEEVWGLELTAETPAQPGVLRTWRENWLPIRSEGGEITGIAVSAEEITRDKEVERRRREAEERYQTMFNSAAVGIGRVSPEGPFLEINDRFCQILGRTREEIVAGGWAEITHPDDLKGDLLLVGQALSGEIDDFNYEKRYTAKDGSDIWVHLTVSAVRNPDRSVKFFIAVVEDIAERKAAEAALKTKEERYRALFESMEQGFCTIQVECKDGQPTDYRFTELNPAFTRQSGLDASMLGRSMREAIPDLEQSWFDRYGEIAASGVSQRFIDRAEPLGRWFEVYAFRIGDPADRTVAILFTDVTDRIRQEESLRNSEREMRLRLNAIPQMVWSTRADGYHDFYNDRWYEFTGTPLGSTDGEEWSGMFHPDDQPRAYERWRQCLKTGDPYEIEYRLRYHDGTHRWVLGRALPVRDEAGNVVRWMGTCTDIDDRVTARRALQQSEARLRAVIEAAPVGLVFADPDGRISGGNAKVEQLLGHEVLPSPDVDSYRDWIAFHPDGRRVEGREYPLAKVLADPSKPAELECQYKRGDGRRTWIRFSATAIKDASGALIGGVVASIDIDSEKRLTLSLEKEVEKVVAEREAAQEALRQSQKLEAMGQLTGGVAHDFNNLLTPIIGSLDLLQRKQILDARTSRLVDGALASAEKARILVQRLLAFARRQPLQPQAVDVARVVAEMSELIASTSGPRVRVEASVPPADLPPALADGNQLEMALLNLAVNARDAMPDGGTLAIAVRLEAAEANRRLGLLDQPHLVLSVSDTGLGMDEETRRRAIEPFFSTKGVGKGTGLGLSMVHGLAAQLGGALDIRSAPGVGTVVELWLPIATVPAVDLMTGGELHERQGAGTVLLVDDEELVRSSTASMLADLGYAVVEAASGEEALRLVREGLRPDLLVTDQLMPGLSGTDLAVELREKTASLPVLVVSGYAELDSLSPSFPHLSKPFRQAELAAALERLNASAD